MIKSIVIDHALLHASNMQLASHTFGSKIFRQHQPYSMIIDDPNFIVLSKAGAFNPQEPLSAILSLRGGSSALSNFSDFIGASKTRCWFVLMFAIILDTVSTTLLKMAKDANSIPKLVAAYFGYALR